MFARLFGVNKHIRIYSPEKNIYFNGTVFQGHEKHKKYFVRITYYDNRSSLTYPQFVQYIPTISKIEQQEFSTQEIEKLIQHDDDHDGKKRKKDVDYAFCFVIWFFYFYVCFIFLFVLYS